MEFQARIKALNRLARSNSDAARASLESEFDVISNIIRSDSSYVALERSLEVLAIVGFRFSEKTVELLASFLEDIQGRKLSLDEEGNPLRSLLAKYKPSELLFERALDVLLIQRYLQTREVLQVLSRHSAHESARIRKKVYEGLNLVVKYDLDVFFGGDRKGGIGAMPQEAALAWIELLDVTNPRSNFSVAVTLLGSIVSPTMEGGSWSSNAFTWTRANVPSSIADLRSRAILLLERLFEHALTTKERISVVGALYNATCFERRGAAEESIIEMILRDSLAVLKIYALGASADDMPTVQKIEHNSYWIYQHARAGAIKTAALKVKEAIDNNGEYSIYRILIGFEGIFGDWDKHSESRVNWSAIESRRKEDATDFARNIDEGSFADWRARILSYATVESDDLATFPVFYHFLDTFASAHAEFALDILENDAEKVAKFLIPLLRGVLDGPCALAAKSLIQVWLNDRRDTEIHRLFASAKVFLSTRTIDMKLLAEILAEAGRRRDIVTVRQVVAVTLARYPEPEAAKGDLKELFFRALETLTEFRDATWVQDAWFRAESRHLLTDATPDEVEKVLSNLVELPQVGFQAEEVLAIFARTMPAKVIVYFCSRIEVERHRERGDLHDFEAIPFGFQTLSDHLSAVPREAVNIVLSSYRADDYLFQFRGAKLLHNIFPAITKEFEEELGKLLELGESTHREFVIGILKNYHGETFVHRLCKMIIDSASDDDAIRTDVALILQATGVVSGELGFVHAYEQKREEIRGWLQDPNVRVREFAKWYMNWLETDIEAERKRAEEERTLRKFKYGEEY